MSDISDKNENIKGDHDGINRLEFLQTHAWQYFEYHAKQRVILIRYFIVFVSAFITGVIYLALNKIENNPISVNVSLIVISLLFIWISFLFHKLDKRNRSLVHLAEDALRKVEENNIFDKEQDTKSVNQNAISAYCIFRTEKDRTKCCHDENCKNDNDIGPSQWRHTRCFRYLFYTAYFIGVMIILISSISICWRIAIYGL